MSGMFKSLAVGALLIGTVAVTGWGIHATAGQPANAERKTSNGNAAVDVSRWNKPDDATIRSMLTAEQYNVTQEDGTERPFKNTYWDNKAEGIYVDVVTGEPLFSSKDKFKSGTGWPSFTRPLVNELVVEKPDWAWGMRRTELRSRVADSHLGHVFDDGPPPTGLRYCINSASLRFVPKDKLAAQGYAEFLEQFEK